MVAQECFPFTASRPRRRDSHPGAAAALGQCAGQWAARQARRLHDSVAQECFPSAAGRLRKRESYHLPRAITVCFANLLLVTQDGQSMGDTA
jgi:hypothetical protein